MYLNTGSKIAMQPVSGDCPKYYVCSRMNPAQTRSLHLGSDCVLPFTSNSFHVSLAPWSPAPWLLNLHQHQEASRDGKSEGWEQRIRETKKEWAKEWNEKLKKAEVSKVSFLWSVWRQASNIRNYSVTVVLTPRVQLSPVNTVASVPVVIWRLYVIFNDLLIEAARIPFFISPTQWKNLDTKLKTSQEQ